MFSLAPAMPTKLTNVTATSVTPNFIRLTAFAGATAVGFAILKAIIEAKESGSNLESK